MKIQYDLITFLHLFAAASGLIWLLDALVFARRRRGAQGEDAEVPAIVEFARCVFPVLLALLVLRRWVKLEFALLLTVLTPEVIMQQALALSRTEPLAVGDRPEVLEDEHRRAGLLTGDPEILGIHDCARGQHGARA